MSLTAFIINLDKFLEDDVVGEWIEFPIDEYDLEEVLERIGIDGNRYKRYFFTDYDLDMDQDLNIPEGEDIDTLNELAEILDNLDSHQEDLVNAIIEEYGHNFDYVLELLRNIDDQELIDVDNEKDLGHYIIDNRYGGVDQLDRDTLERFFDYEGYGAYVANDYGKTSYGYLRIR